MRRRGVLAMPLLAGGALGACQRGAGEGGRAGGEPIRNHENVSFPGPGTLAQREEQIQRAALAQRWVVESRGQRLLRATYTQRRYQAVVEIPYTRDGFSIRYVSSQELEQSPGYVLRDYNQWVERLQRAIVTGR